MFKKIFYKLWRFEKKLRTTKTEIDFPKRYQGKTLEEEMIDILLRLLKQLNFCW